MLTPKELNAFYTSVEQEPIAGRYTQVLRTVKDGVDYSITEYVKCCGEIGYQTFVYESEDDKNYVSSKGYGAEAEGRTISRNQIITNTPN